MGLDLMTDAKLLEAIRAEFDQRTAGKPYKSLNDSKTNRQGKLSGKEKHHYECCIHGAMEHFGIEEPAK
jgi:aminobenzoyl-glutamate utilization protein B